MFFDHSKQSDRHEKQLRVRDYDDIRLGHLMRRPSSQRIYKSSAIGDLVLGSEGGSITSAGGRLRLFPLNGDASDEVGRPEISSCSSVTTKPFAVITLLRTTRSCGKSPCDV